MQRFLVLIYGVVCYAAFLAVLVYAIGFIGGFAVPTTLDGAGSRSIGAAFAIDVALLALFAVQHSGMARPSFKRWVTRFIPWSIERSTYVLTSSAVLALFFWQWEPVGVVVWSVENELLKGLVRGIYFAGWGLLVYVTFLIDHFELFGLRQVWNAWRRRPHQPPRFRTPTLYRFVRHPLYVAWLTIFWAAPTMTAGHLLFAVATTLYILVAIRLEERDLVTAHGRDYEDYRQRVPMLWPRLGGYRKPSTRAVPGSR